MTLYEIAGFDSVSLIGWSILLGAGLVLFSIGVNIGRRRKS